MSLKVFTVRQIEIMEAASARIHHFGIQELTIKNLAADLNLSEAALYRHFKSKNDILLGVLGYFFQELNFQVDLIVKDTRLTPTVALNEIFDYLFYSFEKNPGIASVIFSEGIFQYNPDLTDKIKAMIALMHSNISSIIREGQTNKTFISTVDMNSIVVMVMGTMRMVVLKWKLGNHQSNLSKEGKKILTDLLIMITN